MKKPEKGKVCPKHRVIFHEGDECLKCLSGHRSSWYVLDVVIHHYADDYQHRLYLHRHKLTYQPKQPKKELPPEPVFGSPMGLLKELGS